MQIGMFRFVDTMSFMPSSLEKLVDLLQRKKKIDKFAHIRRMGGQHSDLLCSKGIYPYEYITSVERLRETQLPKKEDFDSVLTGKSISEDEYQRAHHIWKAFKCRTLSDYTRLYCRSDTHLLADVWRNFTEAPFSYFGIHPEAGYVTLPSYAFDCFKQTIHRLNGTLMRVMDESMKSMYEDISKGIRGGSCMLRKKVSLDTELSTCLLKMANEKETYEYEEQLKSLATTAREETRRGRKSRKVKLCSNAGCVELARDKINTCVLHAEKTLLALDFNNLYGWAMTTSLPLDSFASLEGGEIVEQQAIYNKILKIGDDDIHIPQESSEGFIFVAKLEFPKQAQKNLQSYPLIPEQLVVEEEMLSKNQIETWSLLFGTKYSGKTHKKMVNSFATKQEYTVHYRNLAFYCSLGVKATLLRGYKFRQEKFIAPYVNLCTSKRKEATDDFDKDTWKRMNNIVFGKLIEDPTKRSDVRYYNTYEKMDSCLKSHVDAKVRIINENLVQAVVKKRSIQISQPIHVGFAVLEASKLQMAKFWYRTVLPTFQEENVDLLYSGEWAKLDRWELICQLLDTDSYYIEFTGFSYEQVLDALQDHIDFSNFPTDHPRYSSDRKAEFGYVKVIKFQFIFWIVAALENYDCICIGGHWSRSSSCVHWGKEKIVSDMDIPTLVLII